MSEAISDLRIIPSCGCIFCDLDLKPELVEGRMMHVAGSPSRTMVPCLLAEAPNPTPLTENKDE